MALWENTVYLACDAGERVAQASPRYLQWRGPGRERVTVRPSRAHYATPHSG